MSSCPWGYVITYYAIPTSSDQEIKDFRMCANKNFKIVMEEKNIVIGEKNLISRIF